MKKMVAVGLVGLAVGLVMPRVVAQSAQAEVQKWEQFCEGYDGVRAVKNSERERKSPGEEGLPADGCRIRGPNTCPLLPPTDAVAAPP